MAYRKVTVLGGSGFLGRYIVQRLAKRGAVVRVGVRDPEHAHRLQPLGDVGQIIGVRADVRDPESLARACAGVDAVINLVGILYESGKSSFQSIHVDGAANVARAAREAGVKQLVHVSAIGADRGSPSAYARSKAAGEEAIRKQFPQAVILRPSVLFGPEDEFFNRFASLARWLPVLPIFGCPLPRLVWTNGRLRLDIYGEGGTRFQPAYVGDVADAVLAVLDRPGATGKLFELGGPHVYSFKDLMELIPATTGRRCFLVPLPFWVGTMEAFFFELLPGPPILTRDQVKLLKRDNVVAKTAAGFADLDIAPRAAEVILPTYLGRHRRGGQFRSRLA